MANPYHDETGRFCSKGEMKSAIDRLAISGRTTEYLALRKELDEIEAKNHAVTVETLQKAFSSAHRDRREEVRATTAFIRETNDEQALRVLHETIGSDTSEYARLFLEKENLPEDVRDEIIANLSEGDKNYLISTSNGAKGTYYTGGKPPLSAEVVNALISSSDSPEVMSAAVWKVGKEEGLALADKSGHPQVFAAYLRKHDWNAEDPNFENRVFEFAKKNHGEDTTDAYPAVRGLAEYGKSAESMNWVLDNEPNYRNYVVSNPNVTPEVANKALTSAADDLDAYKDTRKHLLSNPAIPADYRAKLESVPATLISGAPDTAVVEKAAQHKAEAARINKFMNSRGSAWGNDTVNRRDFNQKQFNALRAEIDAYDTNYTKLKTEHARVVKNFNDGKVGEVAYKNMVERLEYADAYRARVHYSKALAA